MILAAADCAERNGPPPPELVLAWQVEQWRALPDEGGLRDQEAGLLERMSAALNTYRAISGWRGSSAWAQWAKDNPGGWRMVEIVLKLRGKL
jgi:hypothetical protein